MSDGGGAEAEALRLWLGAQAEALERMGNAGAWDRAEELFRAWCRLLDGASPTAASTATPFDPSEWLKPAGDAGMGLLAGWLGGGAAGGGAASGEPAVEWRTYLDAPERHRAITGAAWLAAFREFAESRRAERDAKRLGREPPDWPALVALWQDIADREFAAVQRSDDYLAAQATLMRAGLDARARARAQVEAVAEALGLPTRAEVDDLAEQVETLRRALRRLEERDR